MTANHIDILNRLFLIEHRAIASKLKLVPCEEIKIDQDLVYKAIGMIDEFSRIDDDVARKVVVAASAVLWTYKNESWDGLRETLMIFLSRSGFSPSTIMIDKEYDSKTSTFTGVSSFLNQLNITMHQLSHEIFIGERKFLITDFQKKIWKKLSEVKLLGISAPTSAGKSFIILLKAIDSIIHFAGNVIYIVPTLSLVAQVSADFNTQLKLFGISDYIITTTFSSENNDEKKIYVLTQEKALSAFSQSEKPFKNISVLIVDEIQNIEKVANEDDQRSKTLYDTLMEFRYSTEPKLIILSGPRVEGLKKLGIDIFDDSSSQEEKTRSSPVTSFTYAISKRGSSYYFNQYSDLFNHAISLKIVNSNFIKGFGNSQYKDDFISYLSTFTTNLGLDARNIIFSPTTKQARNTAIKLAELKEPLAVEYKIESLVQYIKETIHEHYDLCKTIPRGIVYHHGKTPSHIRSVVEQAIREKLIFNIVCTTTLMQGVNLPAQNVIMRNPFLSIKSKEGIKPKLTDYEIANLRGRAGRLLKDFIGRTFILDENSFGQDNEQIQLFPETEKTLHSGYGAKFEEYRQDIRNDLISNIPNRTDNFPYGFLLTHIRQTILKHNENSLKRLKAVGINLTQVEIDEITELMKELAVPKEICFKNRYWDPLDLNAIYLTIDEFEIPLNVNEDNIEFKLLKLLKKIEDSFKQYYQRYFNITERMLLSVCISAKEWMREKSLKDILSSQYFDSSDKIDERISLIQKEISYGLPMLLKPIYDIIAPTSMFLRFIEIGAYMPITRKMIELNIPRETSIFLAKNYFDPNNELPTNVDSYILRRLREIKPQLQYWTSIQLDNVV